MASLYTACDYQNEDNCQKCILKLVSSMKDHHNLQKNEINSQKDVVDRLWVLSQRYLILKRGVPDGTPYPKDIQDQMECEILHEFQQKAQTLYSSLETLHLSLAEVRNNYGDFQTSLECLDWQVKSPLIEGNEFQKPLYFYIEAFHDIVAFFCESLVQMRLCSDVKSIENAKAIESYQNLLAPHQSFTEIFNSILCYTNLIERNLNKAKT